MFCLLDMADFVIKNGVVIPKLDLSWLDEVSLSLKLLYLTLYKSFRKCLSVASFILSTDLPSVLVLFQQYLIQCELLIHVITSKTV